MENVELAVRIDPSNLNHHLWNNHGTWWIHYTVYPNTWSAERARRSLKTRSLKEARRLRDERLSKNQPAIIPRGAAGVTGALRDQGSQHPLSTQ